MVALGVFHILNVAIETQPQTLDTMNHLSLIFFLMTIFWVQIYWKSRLWNRWKDMLYSSLLGCDCRAWTLVHVLKGAPELPSGTVSGKTQLLRTELFPLLSIQAGRPKTHQTRPWSKQWQMCFYIKCQMMNVFLLFWIYLHYLHWGWKF